MGENEATMLVGGVREFYSFRRSREFLGFYDSFRRSREVRENCAPSEGGKGLNGREMRPQAL